MNTHPVSQLLQQENQAKQTNQARAYAFFERRLSAREKLLIGILSFVLFSLAGLIDWKRVAKTEQLGDCVLGEATFSLMRKDCKKGVLVPYDP